MRLLVGLFLLQGCAATMVSNPGSAENVQYAPVNESERSGMVKYLNQGADFVIKGRRADAYKQMHEACKGSYKIDSEGPQSNGSVTAVAAPGVAFTESNQYWYIRFSCVSK
jgi:hypothetical protein